MEEVKFNVDMQGYLQLTVSKYYAVILLGWISKMNLRSVIYCGSTSIHDEYRE